MKSNANARNIICSDKKRRHRVWIYLGWEICYSAILQISARKQRHMYNTRQYTCTHTARKCNDKLGVMDKNLFSAKIRKNVCDYLAPVEKICYIPKMQFASTYIEKIKILCKHEVWKCPSCWHFVSLLLMPICVRTKLFQQSVILSPEFYSTWLVVTERWVS